jgi:hypothetical protein
LKHPELDCFIVIEVHSGTMRSDIVIVAYLRSVKVPIDGFVSPGNHPDKLMIVFTIDKAGYLHRGDRRHTSPGNVYVNASSAYVIFEVTISKRRMHAFGVLTDPV